MRYSAKQLGLAVATALMVPAIQLPGLAATPGAIRQPDRWSANQNAARDMAVDGKPEKWLSPEAIPAGPGVKPIDIQPRQTKQVNGEAEPLLQVEGVLEAGDSTFSADNSFYDTYTFEVNAGQAVIITLESAEFDTYLLLINSQGEALAQNDDIGNGNSNSAVAVVLPEAGTYRVLAGAYDDTQQGAYRLRVVLTSPDDPAVKKYRADDLNSQGLRLLNTAHYPEAVDRFQQSLAIYQQEAVREAFPEESRWGEATSLNNIGTAYNDLGQHAKASEYYEQSLAIYRAIADRGGEAISLNNIGNNYSDLGQYSNALEYYQQSLAIRQELDDRRGEATLLNNIGSAYGDLGQYPEALDYHQRSLAISQSIHDRSLEASSFNNIGFVYISLGQYDEALRYYQQSLAILQEVNNRSGEAVSLNNIGNVYDRLGDYPKALDYYQQALAIRQDIGDRNGEGDSLSNIGIIYDRSGQYSEALDYYQRSLAIRQEIGDRRGESNSLNNVGYIYDRLGDYPKALDYYQQSLAISQEISDQSGEAISLNNIGGIYDSLGDYPKALDYYQQALAIQQKIGDRSGESTTLNNIGFIYGRLEQHAEALNYYQQALAIRRDIGDRNGEGISLNNIGWAYNNLGQYSEALSYYQQALVILQAIGDRATAATSLSNIGGVLASQNQPELAIVFYKQSVNAFEAIRGSIRGLDTDLQTSYTNSIAKTYRNLADLLLQRDRVLEAQRVLDLLKVQELDDYLQDVRGNAQTASGVEYWRPEQDILDRYQSLQDSAIALGAELAELNAKKNAGQITPDEEQRRLQLAALQSDLAGQFNAFATSDDVEHLLNQLDRQTLRQTVDLEDLSGLRNNLADLHAALIYPLILDDRIELVITTANTEPLRRTVEGVGRSQLNATITEFRQALENPRSDAKTPAQQLYQWLIQPLEADLAAAGVDTLIYSPDGALRYIPLGALYDGDQWLAQRFRINNITARSLQELTAQPQPQPHVLAGAFADRAISYSIDGMTFSGLPFAGEEVLQVRTALPSTTTLIDRAFSLREVVADVGRFNILHFATHAAFLPGDPSQSFILFGNGDAPTLKDIEIWYLSNVDLVVLSACDTGLGGFDNNGEQILGLGYQFQARGAKAVIASLWEVNDNSTQVLMTAFYTALQQGMTKTAALQAAQQALIADDMGIGGGDRGTVVVENTETPMALQGRLSHPYYWAPFILIGNGL